MRSVIHDQVSHKLIDGPTQSDPLKNNFRQGIPEKAVYHADLAEVHELGTDVNAHIYDIDRPYYDANKRYD